MRIVDTKGQVCPAPLIAAKRALKETGVGESFVVLTDNMTSFNNLSRFLKDNGTDFISKESDGVWTLTVTKNQAELIHPKATEYCKPISHFEKGNFVVVVSSDKMGEGDEKLGHLLIVTFIRALKDLDKLPGKIVFYNSGVKMATKSSPVIEDLRDLEKMGVELLICSTCLNFYCLETVLGAGTVSNMYSIAEAMAAADKIIRP